MSKNEKVQFAERGKLLDHAARFMRAGVGAKVAPRHRSAVDAGRIGTVTHIKSDPDEVMIFTVEFADDETPCSYTLRNLGLVDA